MMVRINSNFYSSIKFLLSFLKNLTFLIYIYIYESDLLNITMKAMNEIFSTSSNPLEIKIISL